MPYNYSEILNKYFFNYIFRESEKIELGGSMAELTKLEEQILLSVWKLGDNAYGLTIYRHIVEITGKKIAIGGIYYPLERLVKKRYLNAYKGEPTAMRGGQSKRYYRLTRHGAEALKREKQAQEAFWKGLPELKLVTNGT